MAARRTIKKTLEYFNATADYISQRIGIELAVTYSRRTKKYTFKEKETNMMHHRIYAYDKTEEEMDVYLHHVRDFAEFFRMYKKEQSRL